MHARCALIAIESKLWVMAQWSFRRPKTARELSRNHFFVTNNDTIVGGVGRARHVIVRGVYV
jgi:hypothetical protein